MLCAIRNGPFGLDGDIHGRTGCAPGFDLLNLGHYLLLLLLINILLLRGKFLGLRGELGFLFLLRFGLRLGDFGPLLCLYGL